MKTKIFAFSIMLLLALGNTVVLVASSETNQPVWPTSWILADTDPDESESHNDFRDVNNSYYYYDDCYLYYRLECFGYPAFPGEYESRYKWFIDADDPFNMVWQGSKVYEAEFLLIVEDSPNPGGDGSGNIYLLNDVNGDGFIDDDWPTFSYLSTPGPILDNGVAGYRIIDHCIDIYVSRAEIGILIYPYFTWATDQEDNNMDSSGSERSDSYCNVNLLKTDLSIVTSDSVDLVHPGDPLAYTLNVTNHGPQDAISVSIQDILPDNVTFINAIPTHSGIIGQTLWWNFTSLAINNSELVTINVIIKNETTPGVITNMAVVYTDTYDLMPGNNEDGEDTTIDLDTDCDGIGDNADSDDDNDGYSDVNESVCGSDPLNVSSVPDDFDSDFISDCVDTDDDNDGVPDVEDDFPYDPTKTHNAGGNNGGSTSYIPSCGDYAEDKSNTPIENNSLNVSYRLLSQPIITGPSEGYIDILYNFSIILYDSNIDIKFIINWGDGTINESDYLAAGSLYSIQHKWIHAGEYNITVAVFDDQINATTGKTIDIHKPNEPGVIAGIGNFPLILFILASLSILLLIGKRKKDNEDKDKK